MTDDPKTDSADAAIYVLSTKRAEKSELLAWLEEKAKEKGYASGGVVPPLTGRTFGGVWIDEFPPTTLFAPRSVVKITTIKPAKPRFDPKGWMKNQLQVAQEAREKARTAKLKRHERLAIESHYRKLQSGEF